MNVYHRLPASANIFTEDDVLHFLAAKLEIPVEKVMKRVIHIKRLRSKAIKKYGELIARSNYNALHSYKVVNGVKIQDANAFKSGMFVVTFEKSIHATQKPGKVKPKVKLSSRILWHVG